MIAVHQNIGTLLDIGISWTFLCNQCARNGVSSQKIEIERKKPTTGLGSEACVYRKPHPY
jgi:hypothetical protein